MSKTKEYTNGEVTVVWKPDLCIHSGKCVGGLPSVFQPKERPWIKVDKASAQDIVDQVKKCPSGALTFYMNNDASVDETLSTTTSVEVVENGPLLVHGALEVNLGSGDVDTKEATTAFCRCGHSENKPYCDGAHRREGFEG